MPTSDSAVRATRRCDRFGHTDRLTKAERVILLVLVGIMTSYDLYGLVTSVDGVATHPKRVLALLTTLALALYAWSPWVATAIMGAAIAFLLIAEHDTGTLLAGSLAAFLVLRLGSTPLILAYVGGLLMLTSAASWSATVQVAPEDIAGYLLIATVAGSMGVAIRVAYARGRRLAEQLIEQEERQREAIIAERRWIASELHDSIARQLTVISLHTQLLDDDKMRETSQQAIRASARKALSDLRFIISLAEDASVGTEIAVGDLQAAIEAACKELRDAGHTAVVEGDPRDEHISRGAEIIFGRVVSESTTNIIKYASPGEVKFVIDLQPDAVTLTISSPLTRDSLPRVSSSTGTGLKRMAERVLGVSGEFSAGPLDDSWQVRTRLPLASASTSPGTIPSPRRQPPIEPASPRLA